MLKSYTAMYEGGAVISRGHDDWHCALADITSRALSELTPALPGEARFFLVVRDDPEAQRSGTWEYVEVTARRSDRGVLFSVHDTEESVPSRP